MAQDERQDEQKKDINSDIWVKGIKTICGFHKKSLLDYVDAMDLKIPDCLGKVKAKIHNDLSQIQFTIGSLFEVHRSGGSIEPFKDSFEKIARKNFGEKREMKPKEYPQKPKQFGNNMGQHFEKKKEQK